MSGKTRIRSIGKAGDVVEASGAPGSAPAAAPAGRLIEQRPPVDPVQEARDLEDVAMAYTEVVHALGVITRTTQAGENSYPGLTLADMAANLETAWERWDTAQRRLIGQQRAG